MLLSGWFCGPGGGGVGVGGVGVGDGITFDVSVEDPFSRRRTSLRHTSKIGERM